MIRVTPIHAGCRLLQCLCVVLLLAGPGAWANEAPAGLTLLTTLADGGDAEAQYGLGSYYMDRHASDSELKQARDWLLAAARQQHVHAMFRLGVMLYRYDAIKDEEQALDWVNSAAEAGLADAQSTLAMYLFEGVGAAQPDCAAAIDWLQKADAVGHDNAASNLVWVLATCPNPDQRDGSRALRLAFDQVYRQGRKTANQMDNLAAAYAATGDFLSAEVAQRKAIDMVNDDALKVIYQTHLDSYLARRPWVAN